LRGIFNRTKFISPHEFARISNQSNVYRSRYRNWFFSKLPNRLQMPVLYSLDH